MYKCNYPPPNYYRPQRFLKRYLICLEQKLREQVDFEETGCFQLWAVPWRLADLGPPPENYLYGVDWCHKIHQDPISPSKVVQLFHLDRHTDTFPSHPHRDRHIFMLFGYLSLLSISFAHFSVKDNFKQEHFIVLL